jgi:bacterioferritin-associated ferredoxin
MIDQKPDYLVCTCMGVMYSDICRAIADGYTSYEDLQELLMVGTGCNSCVPEVHDILREHASGSKIIDKNEKN